MSDALRLARATQPIGMGCCNPLRVELGYDLCTNESDGGECLGHPTPGRVHVFPAATGVRVTCNCDNGYVNLYRTHITEGSQFEKTIVCPDCQGRGWTAATDGFTWLMAFMAMDTHLLGKWIRSWDSHKKLPDGGTLYVQTPPDDLVADLFAFAARAVEAQGWQLMEVKDADN